MPIPTLDYVIEAIQRAAQGYHKGAQPGGIRRLAAEMDMRPSSLGNALNPYADRDAVKLGLEQAMFIMRQTGDHSALTLMAGELGYRLTDARVEPNHPDVRDEALDDCQAMATFHELARDAGNHPSVIWTAAQRLHKDIDETMEQHRREYAEKHPGATI